MSDIWSKRKCAALYRRLADAFPGTPFPRLNMNQFQTLVSVVLSAQSPRSQLERATGDLFVKVSSARQMLDLGETELRHHLSSLNLFKTKAKHVIGLSAKIVDEFGGRVPRDRDDLLSLPGVGPKTADVILNNVFDQPTIAVDTHVLRVCRRTGMVSRDTAAQVAAVLPGITPARYARHANHLLFSLGHEICLARRPECWRCPVRDICEYPCKTAKL